MGAKPRECKSCDEPTIWCRTEKGNRMLVNYDPDPAGNIEIVPSGNHLSPTARVHSQPPLGVTGLHLSHFATCPNAKEHRRR